MKATGYLPDEENGLFSFNSYLKFSIASQFLKYMLHFKVTSTMSLAQETNI